jgi:23S rRNA (uracil747-C5)-methyltransferase
MKTFCTYFNQGICSSCGQIKLPYAEQLNVKVEKLTKLLSFFEPYEMLSPVGSTTTGFRNKAKFSITGSVEFPIIGLTGEEELDQGREIKDCPLHHPEINKLAHGLASFIQLANLRPYQIKNREGELKGAIIYFSPETQQMYLRLVLRSKESLDRIRKHSSTLLNQFPQIKCLSANIQAVPHAILEGEDEIFFTQNNFIEHKIGEAVMALHPQGFVQTNQEMAEKLYFTAASWVKDLSPNSFTELFSGQGAFSFFIQKYVKVALGVEINPEAVKRANQTAKEMNWNHLSFIAEDAGKITNVILKFNPEVILVNPPRRGLGSAIELIKEVKSKYFIYSSCNAETLAQDLSALKDYFTVTKVQIFDMFPHTEHFETLVLLEAIDVYKKQ